ncbi:hypothetical protein LBMAG42_15140 [Deltaproteobacteria bacterium]|nr:hypothetical protein LBMAG42_15140 [Deltaproteobacteria bacterium]
MSSLLLLASLLACGGSEAPKPDVKPAEPPKAAEPPPAPTPPPAAPAASGPYTPDELASAAYEKAKAAGADATPNPKSGDAAAIAAGKAQWSKCATCHGETGAGDGIAGGALPQKPAQFTWNERWDATTVGVKHWIILNGIQGTSMAPLGLTDDQAWEVLAFIEADFHKK